MTLKTKLLFSSAFLGSFSTDPARAQTSVATQVQQASATQYGVVKTGTTTGTVTDGGVFSNAMQTAAQTFLTIAAADNGLVHVLGLGGVVETVGRTLAARAGDVWNIADHGADGTAANDDTALSHGIAYAVARGSIGTHLVVPMGTWAFFIGTSAGSSNFDLPPYTSLEGMSQVGTRISWNDATAGNYLFGTNCASGSPQDVTMRNFTVQGTWGVNNSNYTGNLSPIFMTCGTNFRADHVSVYNSAGFGMAFRDMVGLQVDHLTVSYTGSDGIQLEGSSNVDASNLLVTHTADDCISAHSYTPYDTFRVRRNVSITNSTCFDSGGIDVAGARSVLIAGNKIDSFHLSAIVVAGDTIATQGSNVGGGSGNEGENSPDVVEMATT